MRRALFLKRPIAIRLLLVAILAFFLFSTTSVGAKSQESPSFEKAEFTYSSDPAKLVLFVSSSAGLSGKVRSMALYGDGRLELRVNRGSEVLETHDRLLTFEESKELIRVAIAHGLAEYDSTRLYAEKLKRSEGQLPASGHDFTKLTVLLSLESYQRGSTKQEEVEKTIRSEALELEARAYRDLLEIRGLVALSREMSNQFRRARAEQESSQ